MARDKTLKLSIQIAGKVDKSLQAAINSATRQTSGVAKTISSIGTAGLVAMTSLATGTAAALADCKNEAVKYQNALGDVIKYVNGLADATGRISNEEWKIEDGGNGKTYAENYENVYQSILRISSIVPMTKEELAELTALMGQSGKSIEQMFKLDASGNVTGGLIKDAAVMAAAWDIGAKEAADYGAKWENAFKMNHKEVMTLANQINYLGANSATTAAEIANAVNHAASLGQLTGITPATTAALADAMLATGVASDRVGTSIKRMALNLSKGTDMTKKQKGVLAEMGLTAEWVAKTMTDDTDGVGSGAIKTLNTLFDGINKLPEERRLNAVGQLFGVWAAEGGAKIANNLDVYQKALAMVADEQAYMNSMQREFDIKTATPEAIRSMRNSAIEMFKVNVGKSFVPVTTQADEAIRQLFLRLNDNMPELQKLSGSLADLATEGISKVGDAIERALPYISDVISYVNNNGKKVEKTIGGIALALVGMKFAPAIEGVGSLLFGTGGAGSGKKGGLFTGLFTGGMQARRDLVRAFDIGREAAGLEGGAGRSFATGATGVFAALANMGGLNARGTNRRNAAWGRINAATLNVAQNGLFGAARNAIAGSRAAQYVSGVGAAGRGFFGAGKGMLQAMIHPKNPAVGQTAVGNLLGAFGGFLSSGAGLFGKIASPFAPLLAGAVPVVGAISAVIAVVSILGDHLGDVRGIIENVFGKKGTDVFDKFTGKLSSVGDFIKGLFQENGVKNATTFMRARFASLLDNGGFLQTLFGGTDNGLAAFDGLVSILQSVMGVVGQVVSFANTTVKPIITEIFTFITQTVIPSLVQTFTAASPLISAALSGVGNVVMFVMQTIGTTIKAVLPVIEWVIEKVLTALTGVTNFISGVFTGNWRQAWEGVKQIFKTVFEALATLVKLPMNAVISLINKAISGINAIKIELPDWVPLLGGKKFGPLNIPTLPMLARGGFTNGPSIAGEAGREAVISFQKSERAKNIGTWAKAGEMLGIGGREIKQITAGSQQPTATFAPSIVIQINGNADEGTMQQAGAELEERLNAWWERKMQRERRFAY